MGGLQLPKPFNYRVGDAGVARAPTEVRGKGLFDLLASIFDRASKEQFMRFVGEYQVLAERDQIRLSDDARELFQTMVDKAAHEHGLGNLGSGGA